MNPKNKELSKAKAFYFFTSIGNYTGESATSIEDFLEKIGHIDIKSIEFHFYRGDFEKWMAEVVEDRELAEQIKKLQDLNLTGEKLRDKLRLIMSKRGGTQNFPREAID
ncbi:MAG: DUF5752 family protein [Candidatus Bathycorpusculaceae bacterium]